MVRIVELLLESPDARAPSFPIVRAVPALATDLDASAVRAVHVGLALDRHEPSAVTQRTPAVLGAELVWMNR